ncbi:MAG: hypothetical protein NDJ65_04730 [Paludibacteraceae bacterium]|nr:hypothetical protein [Paludibacteraceae bacterium]
MKKLSYLFIALLTSMSIMTSCSKDDKDEATDNTAAALDEYASLVLDPTIDASGDNIVLTWDGKYFKATETIVFTDGVCSSAEYTGSLNVGSPVYAQLLYGQSGLLPDGYDYGVEGSTVTMSRSDISIYGGQSKEMVLAALQMLYE